MTFARLGCFLLVLTWNLHNIFVSNWFTFSCFFFLYWLEELVRSNYLEDANTVFLKGAAGGLRATDKLYDMLIEQDCKAGDHSNALTISYEMEAAGRMATTFHFNCLLSVQVRLLPLVIALCFSSIVSAFIM